MATEAEVEAAAAAIANAKAARRGGPAIENVLQVLKGFKDGKLYTEVMEDARAALAAAEATRSGSEAGWRDFETAPRDGSHFLVCLESGSVDEAYWDVESGELYAANTDRHGYHDRPLEGPNFWQPMPAPCRDIR